MTNQQQQKTQIGNSSNPVLRDNIVLPLYFYLMEHRAMADFESAQLDGRRAHINHNSLRQILQYEGAPLLAEIMPIYMHPHGKSSDHLQNFLMLIQI